MTARPPRSFPLPFPLSVISRAGDRWRRGLAPIDADRLRRAACRVAGLDDFGDDDGFGARFEQAVESLNRVDLNLIGRLATRTMFTWHLINRLTTVHVLARHPEVLEQDVSAPIVIVGLFRTGTTFLHNVMAADPGSRAGRTWELCYPVGRPRDPMGDLRWRRRRTSIPLTANHVVVPDQDVVHYVDIDAYEEDFFLLGTDMALMTAVVGLGDWDYAHRLLDADLSGAYRWHRLQLQMLSAQRAGERWLLKCPWHLWNLEALLQAYPRARIVHIHRDVAKAIGSQCSLTGRIVSRMHRDLDLRELADFWLEYSATGLARGQRVKDTLPPSQVVDVRLRELRADPGGVIRGVYEQLGLPCDDALVARFQAAAAEEPTFQHGVHDYALEDFGLTAHAVEARLAGYRARFAS